MLAVFHRVWPLAGLTLALVATVSWIALLGYVAIKLLWGRGCPSDTRLGTRFEEHVVEFIAAGARSL